MDLAEANARLRDAIYRSRECERAAVKARAIADLAELQQLSAEEDERIAHRAVLDIVQGNT